MLLIFLVIYSSSNSLFFLGNWGTINLIKCSCLKPSFQLRVNLALNKEFCKQRSTGRVLGRFSFLYRRDGVTPTTFSFLLP